MDTERTQGLAKTYFPGTAGGFGRDKIDKIDTGQKKNEKGNCAEKPDKPDIAVRVAILYTGIDSDLFKVFLGLMVLLAVLFNNYVRRRATQER